MSFLLVVAAVAIVGVGTRLYPQETSGTAADPARIIQFLDQTIDWYRQLGAQQLLISDANDAVFVSDNRQMADQMVRVAFEFARAEADAAPDQPGTAQENTG
jgi:hypothetical protein